MLVLSSVGFLFPCPPLCLCSQRKKATLWFLLLAVVEDDDSVEGLSRQHCHCLLSSVLFFFNSPFSLFFPYALPLPVFFRLCLFVLYHSWPFFSFLFAFLVLCLIFSVQDGDNGGKSTRCCWLMDQNFPWFGFSPSLPPVLWFPVSSFSFP